jgi:hypothetical protein
MVNHNTQSQFAAQVADESGVSRATVLQIATYADHEIVTMSPKPMSLSPQEDGIAI